MSYFATEYTIHFDDTMAYGSHHFLTAFKFQCASRESYLFGDRIFDVEGVREALDGIHLFTSDAYSRNLNPLILGDRAAVLLTLEEWGRVSVRFCYRTISANGTPICAGFQTMICADAETGKPMPVPEPLWDAMRSMTEIEEPPAETSFRDRVLAGGAQTESLFLARERNAAMDFLSDRYATPKVIEASADRLISSDADQQESEEDHSEASAPEAWVFAGQGSLDHHLLSHRVLDYRQSGESASTELDRCARIAQELVGGDAPVLVSGSADECAGVILPSSPLWQVGIHLQNVLGAKLRQRNGFDPMC